MRRVARQARILGQLDGDATRVAAAFGIGVFLAFFPLVGIHTPLALGLAVLLRLNKVAILLGAWINNPWTIAPMYGAGTLLGCWLMGIAPATGPVIDWKLSGAAFYASAFAHLQPLLWPFVAGNLVLGAACGLAAFVALRAVLLRRRPAQLPPAGPGASAQ